MLSGMDGDRSVGPSSGGRGDRSIPLPLILCYHAVSPTWSSPLAVTPDDLATHVRYLLRRGYEPRTLAEAMASSSPARTFVVTFDDAYSSILEHALPVLSRLNVVASLFVPTEIVDRCGLMTEIIKIPIDWVGEDDDMRAMSWDDVRHLSAAGWEIGSHTCSHPELTKVDETTVELELRCSREACEDRLQTRCRSFAYPFGSYDRSVLEAVGRSGYTYGVTLEQHVLDPLNGRGLLELPRDGMYPSTGRLKLVLHASRLARALRFSASYSRAARRWIWRP